MLHVRPNIISAQEVSRLVGHEWICPFCAAENTKSVGDDDIGWVATPLRRNKPSFICLGCCEDIYSTCASPDYDTHAYRGIVQDVAKQEGLSEIQCRRLCIEHQLRIIAERCQRELHPEYEYRHQHLQNILSSALA